MNGVNRILFVCHGNICRSPMAEYVMKDLVKKAGLAAQFHIELAEHGISCAGHAVRQLTREDYDRWDLLIGMDGANLRNMRRICGGDPAGKLRLLLDCAGRSGEVADPWYTGDFETTWRDVLAGCRGLLRELTVK